MNILNSLFSFAFLPLLGVGIAIALIFRAVKMGRSRPGSGMMSRGDSGSPNSPPGSHSWFSSDSSSNGSGFDSGASGCGSDSGGGDGGGCGGGDGGGGGGGD